MKTTTLKAMIVLILAGSLTVQAEGAGGGKGGQRGHASVEQKAERLMTKHDADKDGKLSQAELTQALGGMQARGGKGAAGGGKDGPPNPAATEKGAAKMIEEFSFDKQGLTYSELVRALKARRAAREERGGKAGGAGDKRNL